MDLSDRKAQRSLKRIRKTCGIPDSVTDEEILEGIRRVGVAANKAGITMREAVANLDAGVAAMNRATRDMTAKLNRLSGPAA